MQEWKWRSHIVPDRFGPDLPTIREWTVEHFSFAGYVPNGSAWSHRHTACCDWFVMSLGVFR